MPAPAIGYGHRGGRYGASGWGPGPKTIGDHNALRGSFDQGAFTHEGVPVSGTFNSKGGWIKDQSRLPQEDSPSRSVNIADVRAAAEAAARERARLAAMQNFSPSQPPASLIAALQQQNQQTQVTPPSPPIAQAPVANQGGLQGQAGPAGNFGQQGAANPLAGFLGMSPHNPNNPWGSKLGTPKRGFGRYGGGGFQGGGGPALGGGLGTGLGGMGKGGMYGGGM